MAKLDAAGQAARYHHGDLREAAIATALEQVETGAEGAVGVRAVAARIGVSPAALYRHFSGHEALLAAAAARGFTRLRGVLLEAAAAADTVSRRLELLCVAYVEFGATHPGVYRLIFTRNHFAHAAGTGLGPAALDAFAVLEQAVAACRPGLQGAELRDATTATWAALHGAVTLRGAGLIPVGAGPADAEERLRAARAIAVRAARSLLAQA